VKLTAGLPGSGSHKKKRPDQPLQKPKEIAYIAPKKPNTPIRQAHKITPLKH